MSSLPARSGISLKPQHYQEILATRPHTGWFEIHPENYMCAGGPPHRYLSAIRETYPLSMHGVGMSLGSSGVSEEHLTALKLLVDRYQPAQISEHLSWSHWNQVYMNDLLPLPYTEESLNTVCENIDRVQQFLKRSILIENPSTYIDFRSSDYTEADFLARVCKRTGCRLLLDINNVCVSGSNNGFDPYRYLDSVQHDLVGEIHLAGHATVNLSNGSTLKIDDHGSEVRKEVWQLFRYFFNQHPAPVPTLIEWDTDIPALSVLMAEAEKADSLMLQKEQAK